VVVNPRQVRDFAKGMGQKAKTDPIDAQVLAQFAHIVKPAPKLHSKPQIEELSELVRRRRQLNDLRTQESNRLATVCHPKIRKSIQKMIKTLNCQTDEIDQLIRNYIDTDDDFKNKDHILQSVPGVGPQTSAMLIANLPELGTSTVRRLPLWPGLHPGIVHRGNLTVRCTSGVAEKMCEVSCIWQRLLPVVLILLYAHLPIDLETMGKLTK